MKIQLPSQAINSGDRLHLSKKVEDGETTFVLRKPTRGENFGRGAVNLLSHILCVIPGVKYTKNWANPREWRDFRNALIATHAGSGAQMTAEIDKTLSTYSSHKRLTLAKVANILADVERAQGGQPLKLRAVDRLNASQGAGLRAINSLRVACRGLNSEGQELLKQADLHTQGQYIKDVLRPGKTMRTGTIQTGQEAIKAYVDKKPGTHFEHASGIGQRRYTLNENLTQVLDSCRPEIDRLKVAAQESGARAILSIPLGLYPPSGLKGKLFHPEAHSVALLVDFTDRKMIFLDSKGHSLETAQSHYPDSGDMRVALAAFGHQLFGEDWKEDTGILQLTQAKQQGANDCGAFTHNFTKRLVDGESVGDIERDFSASNRWQLRNDMATDILTHLPFKTPAQLAAETQPVSTSVSVSDGDWELQN